MQLFRAIALVLFLLLTAAMAAWQGSVVWDMASFDRLPGEQGGLALCVGVLVLCIAEWLAFKYAGQGIQKGLWVITTPFRWLLGGAARLVMGKGVDVSGFWRGFQVVLLLVGLNVCLPLALAGVVAPNLGLPAGIAAVLLQFFLYTDVHIGRALVHFFSSGASAFISLRYLRKRPISLASVIGVAAGVGVLIVVNSIMNGFVKDYREQIRGSLSHVLMYLSPKAVESRSNEIEAEVWRISLERIKANPKAWQAWEHAKSVALRAWEAGETPRYAGRTEATEFPAGAGPASDLTPGARKFVDELESPSPGRLGMLVDSLPVHPVLGPATPENIALSVSFPHPGSQANPEQANSRAQAVEKHGQQLRADIRTVKYVPRITGYASHLETIASRHPDFESASPRIRNIALLKGGLIPSSPEDASMIVAVDPVKEPLISDLGKYAGAAEFQSFKESHHLRPAADLLEYLLVFEALDSGPVEGHLRAISVEGNGEGSFPDGDASGDLPPFTVPTPDGPVRLVSSWTPNGNLLAARRFIDTAYNVMWPQMDAIRWRPGSPGERLYPIVREGLKEMARAERPDPLKQSLLRMKERLEQACEAWLARPGVDLPALEKSKTARRGPMFGPYFGDDAAVLFLRDRFLDGLRPLKAEVENSLSVNLMGALREEASNPRRKEEYPEGLARVIGELEAEVSAFVGTVLPAQSSSAGVIGETRKLMARLAEVANREENEQVLSQAGEASGRLARIIENMMDGEPFIQRVQSNANIVTPLGNLTAEWDANWATVEARRNAYAVVLPLRTRLLEGEAVGEYHARARAMLPAIPPRNLVWSDSEATIARARSAAAAIASKAFVGHRLANPQAMDQDGNPVPFGRMGDLAARLKQTVAKWEQETLPGLATVAAIEASLLDSLVPALNAEIEAAVAGVSPGVADAVRRCFAPVTDEAHRKVYWQVRAAKPALLLGDTLARRSVAYPGMDMRIMVVRQTEGGGLEKAASLTGDEDFVVGGIYRSGIFADNAQTLYTDFESYAALLGETNATSLVGVKLKDYGPWEGRPLELKDAFEELIRDDRMAAMRGSGKQPVPEVARELHSSTFMRPAVRVDIWELERAKLLQAVEREKTLLTLLLGLNMVLAGIVILIVVYLTVVEKVKDIGILKALGASPWGIRSIFMFNALFIGLFGTLIGGAAGVLISQNLNAIEDWIDATFGLKLFPPDIYYLTYVPSVKGLPLIELAIGIGAPATLWAFFCGILPAVAASKKETVEALHYE